MSTKGDAGKPVWVTEIGWNTNDTYWPCVPPSVTLQQQGTYLKAGFDILLKEDTAPQAFWFQYQDFAVEVESCTAATAQAAGPHGRYRPDLSHPVPVGSSPVNPNNVIVDMWYGLVQGNYVKKPSYNYFKAYPRNPYNVFLPAVLKHYPHICVEGEELVANGNLESVEDITDEPNGYRSAVAPPWQEEADINVPLIWDLWPHSGQWGIWLGGRNYADEEIYQEIEIPEGTSAAEWHFWWYMDTEDDPTTPYDYFYAELKKLDGTIITQYRLDNTSVHQNTWIHWPLYVTDLDVVAGETIRVSFRDETDSSLKTSFYVDEISFTLYCGQSRSTTASDKEVNLTIGVPTFDSPLDPPFRTTFDSPLPTKPAPTPIPAVIGEVGQLNDTLTHTPQTIVLGQHYKNPVVFAQPLSRDGGDTSVIRITDVQSDHFTLYVDEAPNKDGGHTTEAVSYLVLEAGSWELADGTLLEVGKLTTSATVGGRIGNVWEQVSFSSPFSAAPIVISHVQTENDPHWVKTRQRSVTTTGFDVAMEEEEAKTTPHGGEVIGWLAIEAGQGTWNGHAYEATQTANVVTHNWYQISFGQGFGQAPRFVAALATYDGGDSAHIRYSRTSLTADGVQVMVEEDTTWDSETNHTTEVVNYIALEGDGTLTAWER